MTFFKLSTKNTYQARQQQNIIRKTWKKNHQQKIITKSVKTTF